MKTEFTIKPISAYLMLGVELALIITALFFFIALRNPIGLISALFFIIILPGFFFVDPNRSRVLTLFGEYKGTVKDNGFFWVNPFFTKQNISLRARNFDSERVKVNDKIGNPIMISVIMVWRVKETYKAAFEVDNYESFVHIQSDAAVRKLSGMYPYDNFDDHKEITLRSGLNEVNHALELELSKRLDIAGIEVLEARIGYLAYAQEIASAMLKRQQATAIIAARAKIVEGAVGMVEMALNSLSEKKIIELDDERKASMVTNLMVVLTSDKDVSPIVNTGTLNH
ncbi:MAG: SPFH domain-containing protein [Flavobacteriales bacterium]|nr:SPFH domain-containing protein [Flavobacteriales bacterium]